MFAAANPPAVCRLRRAVTPPTPPRISRHWAGHWDTRTLETLGTFIQPALIHGGCQDAGHGEEYGFDAQMNVMFSDF